MVSLLRAAPHLSAAPSRSSSFAGVRVNVSARRVSAARRVAPARAGLFDFLKPAEEEPPARSSSKAASVSYLCLDCGYIYQGDLNKEMPWYKCPVCDVGKNRFTKTQAAGSNYSNLAAAKSAAKKARQSSTTERPRDKLKREAIEMAKAKDAERNGGGGGSAKKGWF